MIAINFIDKIIYNNEKLNKLDNTVTEHLDKNGLNLLRYSMGVIFIWFGALKPLGLSPAEELVENTIPFISPNILLPILGLWEVTIGITFLNRRLNRLAIYLLFAQMIGAMLPLILLPEVCFETFPFVLTLEGQYIIKNLVIISGGIVIGGHVRDEMKV